VLDIDASRQSVVTSSTHHTTPFLTLRAILTILSCRIYISKKVHHRFIIACEGRAVRHSGANQCIMPSYRPPIGIETQEAFARRKAASAIPKDVSLKSSSAFARVPRTRRRKQYGDKRSWCCISELPDTAPAVRAFT
jgi:hypothetical protein